MTFITRLVFALAVIFVYAVIAGLMILLIINFGIGAFIILVLLLAWLRSGPTNSSAVLGSARIADYIDVVLSGLTFEKQGVLLGQTRPLRRPTLNARIEALFKLPLYLNEAALTIFKGDSHRPHWLRLPASKGVHMAFIAPTGGGKSSGNVTTNLLTDPSSAVVMDFKAELLRDTGFVRMEQFGHKVVCVAPFGLPAGFEFPISRFNPFQLIDPNSQFFHDDAGSIANSLVIHSPNNNQPFFDETAEAVIHAIASTLIVEATAEECTLGEIRSIISQPKKLEALEELMVTNQGEHRELLHQLAGQLIGLEGKTRSDVMATANTHLRWLDSKPISHSLSATDFNPGELMGSRGMTIYFHIPVNRLHTYRRYLRVVFSSLTNYIFQQGESRSRQIRFYLDEAYGLGPKLDALYAAMIYGRSYGISLNLYLQAITQIEELFEGPKAKDFLTNVLPVFTNIRDIETAKMVSAWIGRGTVYTQSTQYGSNFGRSESFQDRGGRSVSHSYGQSYSQASQPQVREVLQPEEILQLPPNTTIVTLPHTPPIIAEPIFYFQNTRLQRMATKSRNYVMKSPPTIVKRIMQRLGLTIKNSKKRISS